MLIRRFHSSIVLKERTNEPEKPKEVAGTKQFAGPTFYLKIEDLDQENVHSRPPQKAAFRTGSQHNSRSGQVQGIVAPALKSISNENSVIRTRNVTLKPFFHEKNIWIHP